MVASCAVSALKTSNLPGLDFLLVAFVVLGDTALKVDEETKPSLFAKMNKVLLNHSLPDRIEFVKQLPINSHGMITDNLFMLLIMFAIAALFQAISLPSSSHITIS